MAEKLSDLDELLVRVRDSESRRQFSEAISCYHVGAYRASIVVAWTACVFDIVAKIRELELTGDARAKVEIKRFEDIRREGRLDDALRFEREILDLARASFELLTPQECADLVRLQEDRNRCAHPSMNAPDEPYHPSAELVRYHLSSVASHLLTRPPVQGKAALERLLAEVDSEYFPTTADEAQQALTNGPLVRAKRSLLRNFLVASIKTLLDGSREIATPSYRRILAAVVAALRLHPIDSREIVAEETPKLARATPDKMLLWLISMGDAIPEISEALPDDVVLRLASYTEAMPSVDCIWGISPALRNPALKDAAARRVAGLTETELTGMIQRDRARVIVQPQLLQRAVELYFETLSYDSANRIAMAVIRPLIKSFSVEQQSAIIRQSTEHSELSGAFTTPDVLQQIRDSGVMPIEEFARLAIAAGVPNKHSEVVPVELFSEAAQEAADEDAAF